MPLKLVVGTGLLAPPLTGIGYYAYHLLRELLQIDPSQLTLLCMSGQQILDRAALQDVLDRLESTIAASGTPHRQHFSTGLRSWLRSCPALYRGAQTFRISRQTRALAKYPGWIQHTTDYIGPPHPGPHIITVHDLSHLRHPEMQPYARVQWLKHQLPRVIREATHIITDSEFVRSELLETRLVTDPDRVTAIPLGFDPGFRPREPIEFPSVLSRWGLQHRFYLLAVATLEPRKNFARLLDAYCALPNEVAKHYPLVLTGASGWKNETLRARLARVTLPHRVITTGYVSREAVQVLMAGAAGFVYPSLYEGFGLPVLEAMASGTPVLTADSSSLPEVAGTAALCVDPTSTEALTEGIRQILEQPELARQLAQAGLERSALFSWQRCARAHLSVYQRTM